MAIPSTTPRQVTSQGRSPPPCMAQLATRERALSALLAWTVVSEPPWAGVEGLQQVGGLAAAHFADDDVIGSMAQRMTDEVADGHSSLFEPARLEPETVRRVDPQLERVPRWPRSARRRG